jgi:undecaprenyl-phosphate 4-deoxy-4-formamido-L-arabinose transferase
MPSISVVVPVYNGQESLPELVERLHASLVGLTDTFEIILVNDGSRDQSWFQTTQLASRYPRVTGLDLMRNYGQHNALLAGIRQAHYEVIVTLDDDLQNPPEQIPLLIDKLAEGYDVVYGTPLREQHGLWRDAASRITKLALQSAMGVETARGVSAFRAFRTDVRRAFADYCSSFVSIDVLLTWGTTRFASVPVQHDPRRVGKSNYTFRKLVVHALNMMTGFSTWPLQLASFIGFAFTLFGATLLLYVVGRYFVEGDSVPGFPFLASMIALFSGAQLFALGIIGEYLARMHFRSMARPLYVLRSQVGGSQTTPDTPEVDREVAR